MAAAGNPCAIRYEAPAYASAPFVDSSREMIAPLLPAETPVGKLTVAPVPMLLRYFELTPDK